MVFNYIKKKLIVILKYKIESCIIYIKKLIQLNYIYYKLIQL